MTALSTKILHPKMVSFQVDLFRSMSYSLVYLCPLYKGQLCIGKWKVNHLDSTYYLLKNGFSLIFLFINSDVIFLMFIYVKLLDRMKLERKFFKQNFLHTWSGMEFCKLSNLCNIDTLLMSHRHVPHVT